MGVASKLKLAMFCTLSGLRESLGVQHRVAFL